MKSNKMRLDRLMVEQGVVESRETARRLILAGKVHVKNHPATKASQLVPREDPITVLEGPRFASRAGLKLEKALSDFQVDVTGVTALDIGASTGGFTDCLLQKGAKHVYAVDVGYGQLSWRLRHDPRVTVMERTNARYLTRDMFPDPIDIAVVDVSFISLWKILDPLPSITEEVVALIKPQFEAGPHDVPKGGVIQDPAIHRKVLLSFFKDLREWGVYGLLESPIAGASGNREFLVHLKKHHPDSSAWTEEEFRQRVMRMIT